MKKDPKLDLYLSFSTSESKALGLSAVFYFKCLQAGVSLVISGVSSSIFFLIVGGFIG